jgi:glutamine cyclotransferase
VSDGSSRIVYRDLEAFPVTDHFEVKGGPAPVPLLNELEYINGEI